MLKRETYLESLERDAASFASTLRGGEPAGAVPACPGWDLRELGRHLSTVHRWAHTCIVTGEPADYSESPVDRDELVAWFEEGAARLVRTLTETDPDTETWTFGPRPRTVAFWVRRQAHETAIHLLDARQAVGRPESVAAEFAADGVDEVVTMFFPRQVRLGRREPIAQGVRLRATDVDQEWVLAGDGLDQEASSVATVEGAAEQLYLAVWRRGSWRDLTVKGEHSAASAALGIGLTP